ncbi:MAG: DUF3891 family protein [Bryobacterales bacterium]
MIKRRVGSELWLITQPDHAVVSGYLAAHWGNEEFAQPGYFAAAAEPERLRAETVLAIAEHDNGWWEWEADPELDPGDKLPLGLLDLTQHDGMERWRLGVPRFIEQHPYVSLLISFHAYWLYAPRCGPHPDAAFFHPLFGDPQNAPPLEGEDLQRAQEFVGEQREIQERLVAMLREDADWSAAVHPENLKPHVRLLQLADALSLALGFGGDKPLSLKGITRRNWDDRITLELTPGANRRIVCRPYPFDRDPLPVAVRASVLPLPAERPAHFQSWWQSLERQWIRFEYCSETEPRT